MCYNGVTIITYCANKIKGTHEKYGNIEPNLREKKPNFKMASNSVPYRRFVMTLLLYIFMLTIVSLRRNRPYCIFNKHWQLLKKSPSDLPGQHHPSHQTSIVYYVLLVRTQCYELLLHHCIGWLHLFTLQVKHRLTKW